MNSITASCADSAIGCKRNLRGDTLQSKRGIPMRPTTIITVVAVVFALLVVAKSRTVGITEATGSTTQSTMSTDAFDVGHAGMKNIPPVPDFPPP